MSQKIDVSEVKRSKKASPVTCHNCGGAKTKNGKICPVCGGSGKVVPV